MEETSKESKLQQLSTGIAAVVSAGPALFQGDLYTAAVALLGVGAASVLENIRGRTKELDDQMRDAFEDERLRDALDATVKTDEFLALYVRARDTAAKTEKGQKIRYIRNFLIHAVTVPTSTDADKERYLRLIDELSFREHEYLIGFLRMVVPSAGAQTLEQWITNPTQIAGGMITTYATKLLNVPEGTSSAEVNGLVDELVVAFRHLHSVGLLNGIMTRQGDMFQFQTNGFTSRFLRFVLDPF